MKKAAPRSVLSVSRITTLLASLPLLLCLTQCASSPPPAAGTAGCSVQCNTVNDCTNAANWPLCAKIGSAQCFAAPNGCTYQLKTDPSCPCLERDVRLCNISPGVPGVQICTANASRTATLWGTCTACTTCT